jgi:SOS-response transcriptional repressor LexA
MSSVELDRLLAAMAGDPRPTPFVGAGFSAAVTGGAECATWLGLLRSGIDRCLLAQVPDFSDESAKALKTLLNGSGIDNFLTVADDISRRLRAAQGGKAFRSWIEDTVGKLTPADDGPELVAALCSLGGVIVTTNYDNLIEELQPEWNPFTWTDDDYARATRRDKSVVHLHGIVGKSESIILGNGDYRQLKGVELNQVLSRALFAEHRLIFIGCGSGLGDPNIAPLIKFMDRTMPEESTEHYILVTDDEVSQYMRQPISTRITAVGYGPDRKDLLRFLKELVPAGKVQASRDPLVTEQQTSGGPGTGLLARAKVAEGKLRGALGALGRASDAMQEVERERAVPRDMDAWGYEQQEAEHERRAEALSDPAKELDRRAAEVLGVFGTVEDDVWQLTKPKFAGYTARLGRITEIVGQLEAEAGRLLTRVTAALDDVADRLGECDGYQPVHEALSRAHAAIERAHVTAAALLTALKDLALGTGQQAARAAPPPVPNSPRARQRGAARSEVWPVPVVGSAAAGTPNMPATSEDDFVSIPPQNVLRSNVIAVRVDGDSMIGDDLRAGDYAIVDKGGEFRDGIIAVVRIGDSEYAEMTVKHVWREGDGLRLEGSNPDQPDRPRMVHADENPFIEGTVIGVFRPLGE